MRQRRWIPAIITAVAAFVVPASSPAASSGVLASCGGLARATSLTIEDSEQCLDWFFLAEDATVRIQLEPEGLFAGTIGAQLLLYPQTQGPWIKRVYAAGASLDGPGELTVRVGPGWWTLRAFTGVTPAQPCLPAVPGWPRLVPSCNLAPGAAAGFYQVTVSGA